MHEVTSIRSSIDQFSITYDHVATTTSQTTAITFLSSKMASQHEGTKFRSGRTKIMIFNLFISIISHHILIIIYIHYLRQQKCFPLSPWMLNFFLFQLILDSLFSIYMDEAFVVKNRSYAIIFASEFILQKM